MHTYKSLFILLTLMLFIPTLAQDSEVSPDCLPENLAQQQSTFAEFLTPDFEADSEQAIANLFRLGAAYQEMALRCGYVPNEPEVDTMTIAGAHSTIENDFYVLFLGGNTERATFRIYINPLVNLVWWGSIVLIIGTFIATYPKVVPERPRRKRETEVSG